MEGNSSTPIGFYNGKVPFVSVWQLAKRDIMGNPRRCVAFVVIFFITFLLLTVMGSIFCGLCMHIVGVSYSAHAPIWVRPSASKVMDIGILLPDEALAQVLSVPHVAMARPYCTTSSTVILPGNRYFRGRIVGVDDDTLAGLPNDAKFDRGRFFSPRSVLVNSDYYDRVMVDNPQGKLTINDYQFEVCGTVSVFSTIASEIIIFMKRSDYLSYMYQGMRTTRYILVWPDKDADANQLCASINEQFPELTAMPQKEFCLSTIFWYLSHVAVGQSFGIMSMVVLLFSIAVIIQNLSSFIADNRAELGTLKVLGFSNMDLSLMLYLEILVCMFFGLAIGVVFAAAMTKIMPLFPSIFFYTMPEILPVNALLLAVTTLVSCLISIRKFGEIDPAEAFNT
ncbi:MAG: ABC transporter permease [Victivallaceae bacterium]|nr:ABC transporter permease [Victivallaceae bacterium]